MGTYSCKYVIIYHNQSRFKRQALQHESLHSLCCLDNYYMHLYVDYKLSMHRTTQILLTLVLNLQSLKKRKMNCPKISLEFSLKSF